MNYSINTTSMLNLQTSLSHKVRLLSARQSVLDESNGSRGRKKVGFDFSQDGSAMERGDRSSSVSRQIQPAQERHPQPVDSATCVICSSTLLRHISRNQSYWYCPTCHQKLSDDLVKSLTPDCSKGLLRLREFHNSSGHVQIIRYKNHDSIQQERVIFPGQIVFLEIEDGVPVKIYSNEQITMLAADTIVAKGLPEVIDGIER